MVSNEFQESQSFFSPWAERGLVLLTVLFFAYRSGDIDSWDRSTVAAGLLLTLLLCCLFGIRLRTRIDSEGIQVSLKPFVWKQRWRWQDIKEVRVKKYDRWEYGGWGYRIGRNGSAYLANGSYGFEIQLCNGRRVLVGTRKPENVREILTQITTDETCINRHKQ